MPCRREIIPKNQPVHIFSRAIDSLEIFADESDCNRFIFQLYVANIGSPANNIGRRNIDQAARALLKNKEINPELITNKHSPFVDILDFSLVVNHYHLYLSPNLDNIVPLFMRKLNLGFARYFNVKHQRKGPLFKSRYGSVLIKTELQADTISRYVGIVNPLDVYQPGWREDGIRDKDKALQFLEEYQFSSFPDKIGKRNAKVLGPKNIRKIYSIQAGEGSESRLDTMNLVKDFLKEKSSDSLRALFLE